MKSTHRVHGFHCDLYGHVNNARYLEFLEAARWDLLRGHIDIDEWHRRGWLFVVVRIEISYRKTAGLGDELVIESVGGKVGSRSSSVHQVVSHAKDGARVADATVTFVVLDEKTGRPMKLEGEIRRGLEQLGLDQESSSS